MLGKHIRVGNTDDWREVIGVVKNVYFDGVSQKPPTTVYWPVFLAKFEGQPEDARRSVSFVIRSPRAGSAAFLSQVQQPGRYWLLYRLRDWIGRNPGLCKLFGRNQYSTRSI